MMDPEMRDRVWERWIAMYPSDADSDERMRDALLGTFAAANIAFRIACEDVSGPARRTAIRLADDLDARIRKMNDKALRRAWWRP